MYHQQEISFIYHYKSELSYHVVILGILSDDLIQSSPSLEMSFTIGKESPSLTSHYLLLVLMTTANLI